MSYQLRERNPATLVEMKINVVSVEANFLAKEVKLRTEKQVTIKEQSSSPSDVKLDTLVKTMERMMERMTLTDKISPREPQGVPQVRNPNLRRQQPQIKQRDPINPVDQQQIRLPFQESYVEEEHETMEEQEENKMNIFGDGEIDDIFLTKQEQYFFVVVTTRIHSCRI